MQKVESVLLQYSEEDAKTLRTSVHHSMLIRTLRGVVSPRCNDASVLYRPRQRTRRCPHGYSYPLFYPEFEIEFEGSTAYEAAVKLRSSRAHEPPATRTALVYFASCGHGHRVVPPGVPGNRTACAAGCAG